jgi:hypothetical protein
MNAIPRLQGGWGVLVVCLGFTLPGLAVAEEARDTAKVRARWVDDPYEPHDTYGPNLRVGSAVGWMVHDEQTYTALGGALAVGPRVGRFALEAGYVFAELSEPGPSTMAHGNVHRLSINGRADLVRLGSRSLGPNSMLAIYGEAGVARQLHHWYRPGSNDARRIIPVDAGRTIAVFGFGLNLDHRLEQPLGFPSRIGWQLGWQLTASERHAMGSTIECRGPECIAGPLVPRAPGRDTSLLVTSTIAFTW